MREIVFHRRGVSMMYYVFSVAFAAFGLLFVLVTLGQSLSPEPWSRKWLGVIGYAVAATSWLVGVPRMWSAGKRSFWNEARIGGSRFSLILPSRERIEFDYKAVREVTWDSQLSMRLCTVTTKDATYKFDARSCPRAGQVAQMIAERAGRELKTPPK